MLSMKELQAQYVTNRTGKKVAVILPIEEFEELLEDIEDLAILAERREEPTIPHEEVMAKLKRDGLLQG
jgi:PHD/YefM family antitoxin component YafN of YafNO toxin-antitoxin module